MSFLSDYAFYTSRHESHPQFCLWSALSALSSIISGRVWVDMGHFKLYPNMYVVLVGSPGARKTTAMATAKTLLRQLKTVPISADSTTAESIKETMSSSAAARQFTVGDKKIIYTPLACFVTELSEFIGVASSNMISFLTTIYDEPIHEYKTKKGGPQLIVGPYLSLLGCTTPAWITARLRDDVISGGFSRRAVFIYPPEYEYKNPLPEESEEERDAWFKLLAHAGALTHVGGAFKWTSEGKRVYEHWYRTQLTPEDPNLLGWARSRHAQLLKLSMLIALSEGMETVLDAPHIEASLAILCDVESRLSYVFAGFGRNELKAVAMQLFALLEGCGGVMDTPTAKVKMWEQANDQEFYQVVQHLKEAKMIVEVKNKNKPDEPSVLLTSTKFAELQAERDQKVLQMAPSSSSPQSQPAGNQGEAPAASPSSP